MESSLFVRKSGISALSLSIILAATLSLTSNVAANGQTDAKPSDSKAQASSIVAGQRPAEWKLQNEQEWIVDGVGRDVAEMLLFAKCAKDGKAKLSSGDINFTTKTMNLGTNSYSYKLDCKSSDTSIDYAFTLQDYAWSPKNYEPFAMQIMSALKLKASAPSAIPEDFLKNVAQAEFPALFKENVRISQALSANPVDPSLHEQAAMLQGAFNMLETCGMYSDTRAPLNRMSAHLAMAKVLKQD